MARHARFVVSLTDPPTRTAAVSFTTAAGTAVPDVDYTPVQGRLLFAPGETEQEVDVPIRPSDVGLPAASFAVRLSGAVNCRIADGLGEFVIPGQQSPDEYLNRFNWIYDQLHDPAHGYFGPQTGPNAFTVPRHIPEVDSRIINEAPDYGGESVSETASFWVGLEAWKGGLTGDWSGYNNCWHVINTFYVPSPTNQPLATYDPESPADYIPEGVDPSEYPRLADVNAPVGEDPIGAELETTYGTKLVHLMHWLIDVEGAYGFHNGDLSSTIVFINTYERGLQESSFETVTHPCWGDWENGGHPDLGYEPLYTQGLQWYPLAPFDWSKKWSYTCAPDSEVRAVQWALTAKNFAEEQGEFAQIEDASDSARMMGDYLRYALWDKYGRQIGNNQAAGVGFNSFHFCISWYAAWGGEIPEEGAEGAWSYRIGCSECHQGYQGVDAAYALADGGGGMVPDSPTAGDNWLTSLRRQIDMIRWLQSPEGPIAGGITNSYFAQYITPTDGRQNHTFYGMHYVYSPVWHDPPSNNWVGFQAWGQGRTANLFLEVADKTTALANEVRPKLEVILDPLVTWLLDESELTPDGSFSLPSTLSWVSPVEVPGETATEPNLEGVYEFLPNTSWDGSGDAEVFWDPDQVPNEHLHCVIVDRGADLGVAASMAYMLIAYGEAKRRMGKFTDPILGGQYTPADAVGLAKELLDRTWNNHRDNVGICIPEIRSDYIRMADEVYIPDNFSGTMPNGDVIEPGVTAIDIRSFLKEDPMWPDVEAFINGTGPAPVFLYHRFWAQAEYAISCGAYHKYFGGGA